MRQAGVAETTIINVNSDAELWRSGSAVQVGQLRPGDYVSWVHRVDKNGGPLMTAGYANAPNRLQVRVDGAIKAVHSRSIDVTEDGTQRHETIQIDQHTKFNKTT